MRYLAIDFGLRRLGLAVSDETGTLASPYATRDRKGNRFDVDDIIATMRGLGIERVVLGLPRQAEGQHVHHEEATRAFAAALQEGLRDAGMADEIEWWDERFSTAEALTQMRAAGISQRRGRTSGGANSVDARAAAVILQGFLDRRRLQAEDDMRVSDVDVEDASGWVQEHEFAEEFADEQEAVIEFKDRNDGA
ncbi:MAG: Holliday junction resolvase RuvX [Armatimonadota bacterium]|nr:Holliday junction resolvase RuvX [Armatimonadota bacterium]